jgi:hypothetical protein
MGHPRTTLPPELILKLELVQPTTQQSLRTVWDPSSIAQDLNRSGGESPAPLRTSGIQREDTSHGFLFSNGTNTTIDNPLALHGTTVNIQRTFLLGINDAGQIACKKQHGQTSADNDTKDCDDGAQHSTFL